MGKPDPDEYDEDRATEDAWTNTDLLDLEADDL